MLIPEELRTRSATRVVVIDDDTRLLRALVRVLDKAGSSFDVRAASDGPGGCVLVGEFKPHLVILDLIMPGMDGFMVCRRLSELPSGRRPVIVVLTGYASPENVERALACGADEVMTKPFVSGDLVDRLQALLSQREGGTPESRFPVNTGSEVKDQDA